MESLQRPILPGTARERMNHRETAPGSYRRQSAECHRSPLSPASPPAANRNPWHALRSHPPATQENVNGNPKLVTNCRNSGRFAPYHDTIESNERNAAIKRAGSFRDAQQVESGGWNRACAVRESGQRNQCRRGPDLDIIALQALQSRQRYDEISDRTRANDQPAHFLNYPKNTTRCPRFIHRECTVTALYRLKIQPIKCC